MPESYAEIEAHIEQALHELRDCENPNIAAVAREFQAPVSRLRARWNGRSSKQDLPEPGKRLTDDQELAVYLYRRLDTIRTSARFPMVTSCANSILRRSYDSAASDPKIKSPTVSAFWTSRFLKRHPEFHIHYFCFSKNRSHSIQSRERLQEYNAEHERTPSPSPSEQLITAAHAQRSLGTHANGVIAEALEGVDPESPTGKLFCEKVIKLAKGSLAQVEFGAIAQDAL